MYSNNKKNIDWISGTNSFILPPSIINYIEKTKREHSLGKELDKDMMKYFILNGFGYLY